ncbi:hypothetical protein K431DRAFT_280609 [Polychaeton citri CBS 116435]|uniref:SH3 domain-containing protein n=1 Tax=Polychaeton citri CBS 116435 TaxID=1314669 RepID=A0A9P4UV74_9PEZI|nr:hypothetical protein K431DRAFT_280609 [Polychaeton citri CBS 116435]
MASAPFKVKAVYDYSSPHDDDLNFSIGQVITVTEEEDADWYVGDYVDASGAKQEGLFPRNFVEKYEPEVPSRPARQPRPKQQEAAPPAPELAPAPVPISQPVTEVTEPAAPAPPAQEEPRQPPAPAQVEPPPPAPAKEEPVKKAPPPVAGKSNAFKDRIAAFNQVDTKPIAPLAPGGKPSGQSTTFIKKPYVAPPPSKNAYIPPIQKQEPAQRPYIRDEDPEIKQREEEDRQAAEAAGFGTSSQPTQAEGQGEEPAPQPQSLKERIALLQKQQAEQAQRRAEGAPKAKPKPPSKKLSQTSESTMAEENQELDRVRSIEPPVRQSVDRPRPPVPQEPTSPRPDPPEHEILSDGHEADQSGAGDTTEDDTGTIGPDDSEEMHPETPQIPMPRAAEAPRQDADVRDGEDTTEVDEEEEEEDSMDEETRRKEELRARMAKISGGQGFNPFGMPMPGMTGPAPSKKKSSTKERTKSSIDSGPTEAEQASAPQRVPMMPVPGMAMPGMAPVQSPDSDLTQRVVQLEEEPESIITGERGPAEIPDVEDVKPEAPSRVNTGGAPPVPKDRPVPQPPPTQRAVPPPVPGGRSAPEPPSADSRQLPLPPPARAVPIESPGSGSESGDEMSTHQKRSSAELSGVETPLPLRAAPPPVPTRESLPPQLPPNSPPNRRTSLGYFNSEPSSATSDKRASRPPPPVPSGQPQSPLASPRPPPPPPPTHAPPTRRSTDIQPEDDDETERGESDYEGDYDTDIASGAKHKDALKAPHAREPSLDDSTTADEGTPISSPVTRSVPPPPVPGSRLSMDTPRAPPPVPPAGRPPMPTTGDDDDYDPYKYESRQTAAPSAPSIAAPVPPTRPPESVQQESSDDLYSTSPPKKSMERAPPPPPTERAVPPPPTLQGPPSRTTRQSLDVSRTSTSVRRSGEMSRASMSGDHGQMAQDLDFPTSTPWWTIAQPLPPSLQSRNGSDILTEHEESTTSKRGGRTQVSKDIYVLYMDYSQTVITVRYDSKDVGDASFEQRHEPSPPRPRQDQLETFWQRFGAKISQTVQSAGNKKDPTPLGDGSPQGLVTELLRPFRDALHPVGTRAYGALVYANLANASVMQYDEIRPGDIITLRNAKFEGKHGAMHNKYKQDYGAQHVAIVDEWDGTKKKVRAWEQGRAKPKLRDESFRLADLRSGEVRVWRVVGREYVGWDT